MLTRSGWPRPIIDGWPIPWVSPAESLSTMNNSRVAACASGAICAVCGDGYSDDEQAYAFVKATEVLPDLSSVAVQPMDNGILHKRCAQLALARCPELKRLFAAGDLQIVAMTGNSAEVILGDGRPKGRVDGADCAVISRETLRAQ